MELTKSQKLFAQIGILSLTLIVMTPNAVSPIINAMIKAYPNVSPTTVQSFLSIPTATILIFTLLSGIIADAIGKKRILIIGLIIYTIGGILPLYLVDFNALLISRLILGAGIGLVNPLAASLIIDVFEGPARARLMGFKTTVGSLGQVATIILVGILGVKMWQNSFYVYLIGIIVIIACILWVPNTSKAVNVNEVKIKPVDYFKINRGVIMVAISVMIYMTAYLCLLGNFSSIVEASGLGGPAVSAGIITSMTLFSMFSAMLFGIWFKIFKYFVSVIGAIVFAAAMFVISGATTMGLITTCAILLGIANGLIIPHAYVLLGKFSPKTSTNFSMSIMLVFVNLGSFSSPYLFNWIATILGNNTGRFKYVIAAIFGIGVAGMSLINVIVEKKKSKLLNAV